jgi:hypothetical protein
MGLEREGLKGSFFVNPRFFPFADSLYMSDEAVMDGGGASLYLLVKRRESAAKERVARPKTTY